MARLSGPLQAFLALALVVALVLAGLGASAERVIEVSAGDFYFDPSLIEIVLGETVTVRVTNVGYYPHTFTAPDFGVDVYLDPGETVEFQITGEALGEFEFYCRFHRGQGMVGTIQVKEGPLTVTTTVTETVTTTTTTTSLTTVTQTDTTTITTTETLVETVTETLAETFTVTSTIVETSVETVVETLVETRTVTSLETATIVVEETETITESITLTEVETSTVQVVDVPSIIAALVIGIAVAGVTAYILLRR